MPQFGLLLILVLLPLQMSKRLDAAREHAGSGANHHAGRPRRTSSCWAKPSSSAARTYRGSGRNLAALAVIGAALFAYTLARFRATIGSMA